MMCFIRTGAHIGTTISLLGAIKNENLAQGHEKEWLLGFISPVLKRLAIDPVQYTLLTQSKRDFNYIFKRKWWGENNGIPQWQGKLKVKRSLKRILN